MKRLFLAATVLTAALFAVSCKGTHARIEGTVEGAAGETVYLSPMGAEAQDSVRADDAGRFAFRVGLPSGEATLYNVRVGSRTFTVLPLAGEKVKLNGNLGAWEYSVSGSRESELVCQLNAIMQGGMANMDAIVHSMTGDADTTAKRLYITEYIATKRAQIRFIVEHSHSLAAIYALYQRLPGDATLFNGDSDIVYYRMVADSVAGSYPLSPYLKTLRDVIEQVDNRQALMYRIEESLAHPVTHPNIELKDMYGRIRSLDDNLGRATLVVFSAMVSEESPTNTAALKRLYEEFSPHGLTIYQIGLDGSRTLWLNAVQEQRIPWTSVNDPRGGDAPSVRLYNVKSLPTIFLLDREGNIVGRNLSLPELASKLQKML